MATRSGASDLRDIGSEGEPRPPAFPGVAEGGLRRVFCMAYWSSPRSTSSRQSKPVAPAVSDDCAIGKGADTTFSRRCGVGSSLALILAASLKPRWAPNLPLQPSGARPGRFRLGADPAQFSQCTGPLLHRAIGYRPSVTPAPNAGARPCPSSLRSTAILVTPIPPATPWHPSGQACPSPR
jgi:hypothetical protein